jgi:hypothetical protein
MPRVLNVLNYRHVGLPPGADYIGRANPRYGLRAIQMNRFESFSQLTFSAGLKVRWELVGQFGGSEGGAGGVFCCGLGSLSVRSLVSQCGLWLTLCGAPVRIRRCP